MPHGAPVIACCIARWSCDVGGEDGAHGRPWPGPGRGIPTRHIRSRPQVGVGRPGLRTDGGAVSGGRMGLYFFFQAEDGIRDVAVTGVQTCALPIYLAKVLAVYALIAQSAEWREAYLR